MEIKDSEWNAHLTSHPESERNHQSRIELEKILILMK